MVLGHKDAVNFLSQKGANVNHAGQDGNTALIWGAVSGNLGTIESLVQKNAMVDQTNRNGYTALTYAAKHGKAFNQLQKNIKNIKVFKNNFRP